MWHRIAAFIIKFRVLLLVILLAITAVFGFYASKVELSYDFTSAIPTNNPEYISYQLFRQQFGEDGNLLVLGVQTDKFFDPAFFSDYTSLVHRIEKVHGVENVLSVPGAITLVKDTVSEKLNVVKLAGNQAYANMDSFKAAFYGLVFYKGLLYNPATHAYLMAISINKQILNSKSRTQVVNDIVSPADSFGKKYNTEVHYSGLPFIRTQMANKVQAEMKMFLIMSFLLTALILVFFFRSFVAVLSSMIVVAVGVIWAVGTIVLLGYKITLLTALIPPLIVIIGIPNCVYFLNKYHSEFSKTQNKIKSLLVMVDKMGIITLFTNLTAAIGFGVFYFTKSAVLKEFGLVAGINIIALFFISLVFLPAVFSFMPPPKGRHTSYLNSNWINKLLTTLTNWVFSHRKWIYGFTIVICGISVMGILRLKSDAHIVDDLPKSDKVYMDLKFFEQNFKGVMPLEIIVDTKRKNGILSLPTLQNMDQLNTELKQYPDIGNPLSLTEGVKFASQAYYGGDSGSYKMPADMIEASFILPYLRGKKGADKSNMFSKLINSFVDSTKQKARISVNMADVGSKRLPFLLDSIRAQTNELFDSTKYHITFTGTSIVFLEGSKFIINSLRDSLILAFIMIFGCMIVLFRSWRILLISIVINIVPLLITAGVMGWEGIRIKPSTVLVFSVALGITIDVTIRFLVSFKQDLMKYDDSIADTVQRTIHDTGLSIIYTSLILIAGFGVFMLSQFDGTKSLGYLTSLTLFLAMITNLILQPALLVWMGKVKMKKMASADKILNEIGNDDLNLTK
ncbi:MAG: MMPL family transporter [Flavipsychrobacter sp.]|nr:MMPL family transporter [Flavipsychrobacter sp.]